MLFNHRELLYASPTISASTFRFASARNVTMRLSPVGRQLLHMTCWLQPLLTPFGE
jgi:hypothetical protein